LSVPEVVPDTQAASQADTFVDARGHRCPMPLLMAKRALNALEIGQSVGLAATDPSSIKDFETFARQSGHELLEAREADGEFHLLIRKR
jgi:tRNA 2-thiouridine synthesizing protein A